MAANDIAPSLACLFDACYKQGYHPKLFKKANTVVLKKPGKDNYSDAKSYRPIALLDTIGKILEEIVAKRLSDIAEANNFLPKNQMGARRNRSTETALELLTCITVYRKTLRAGTTLWFQGFNSSPQINKEF